MIKAIFGLGNPGKEYEKTYHSVGQLFCAYMLAKHEHTKEKEMRNFSYSTALVGGDELVIIKQLVFMNDAGDAIGMALRKLSLKPDEIIIIQDDSDIAFGKYKYSFDRSSAGHKGIDSVFARLGTKKIKRIRIGIRKRPGKALAFVLKKISKDDLGVFENVFAEIEARLKTL